MMTTNKCTTNDIILVDRVYTELNDISLSLSLNDSSRLVKLMQHSVVKSVMKEDGTLGGVTFILDRPSIDRRVTIDTEVMEVCITTMTGGEDIITLPIISTDQVNSINAYINMMRTTVAKISVEKNI